MASISGVVERIKCDLEPYLSASSIYYACECLGHRYRRRQFDPVATIHLFVLQILCFNTALTHLRHLARMSMTAAGFCKARQRLPLAVLQLLLRDSAAAMARKCRGRRHAALWLGLRTWLVDGSSTITPDCPATKPWVIPAGRKEDAGFQCPNCWGCLMPIQD